MEGSPQAVLVLAGDNNWRRMISSRDIKLKRVWVVSYTDLLEDNGGLGNGGTVRGRVGVISNDDDLSGLSDSCG